MPGNGYPDHSQACQSQMHQVFQKPAVHRRKSTGLPIPCGQALKEFKWYEGMEVHKLYLRIVSYVISKRNDNPLIFNTFDEEVVTKSQCVSPVPQRLWFPIHAQGVPPAARKGRHDQSMSREAHCIDNGLMEGFWGHFERGVLAAFLRKGEMDAVSAT